MSPERQPGVLTLAVASGMLWLFSACGAAPTSQPVSYSAWPANAEARAAVFDQVGISLYEALRRGTPEALWLPASDLDSLVADDVHRWELSSRRGNTPRAPWAAVGMAYRQAVYLGACFQGVRNEPAGGPVGLTAPRALFDRALVVGRRPDGARIATWVEGIIAFSPGAVRALVLRPISPPRWEHSDLQLAACDAVAGAY